MKRFTEFFSCSNSMAKTTQSSTFQLALTSSNLLRSLQSVQSDIRLMEVEKEIPPNTLSFSYVVSDEQQYVSITTHNPAELLSTFCRVSLITPEDKSRILSTLNKTVELPEESGFLTPLLTNKITF